MIEMSIPHEWIADTFKSQRFAINPETGEYQHTADFALQHAFTLRVISAFELLVGLTDPQAYTRQIEQEVKKAFYRGEIPDLDSIRFVGIRNNSWGITKTDFGSVTEVTRRLHQLNKKQNESTAYERGHNTQKEEI